MDFAQLMCELASEPPQFETKDIFNRIEEDLGADVHDDEKLTAYVLKQMMLENTGRHILDSGGMGGRRWERMQPLKDLDWTEAKDIVVEVDKYSDGEFYTSITKNTYKFLLRFITYERDADKCFHAYCSSNRDSYYSNMKEYCDMLRKFCEEKGLHFDSYGGVNTYNGDSCLDTTLQWEHFQVEEQDYIILQTHNGADVRGGYSAPHIFSLDFDDMLCEIDDLRARCPNHGKKRVNIDNRVQLDLFGKIVDQTPYDHVDCYSDDCGYHWYSNCGSKDWNFTESEDGNYHCVCPKCGAEVQFYG